MIADRMCGAPLLNGPRRVSGELVWCLESQTRSRDCVHEPFGFFGEPAALGV